MDELDALEALVGIGDAEEIACPGEIVASAPEDAELAGLVALAVPPPSSLFRMPRDPHDRGCYLTLRRLEGQAKRKAEVEKMKAERLAQQLSIVKLCKSSDVFALCSASSSSATPLQPLVKGAVLCALAFSRKTKANDSLGLRQVRAARRVVSAALKLQDQCLRRFFASAARVQCSAASVALAGPAEVLPLGLAVPSVPTVVLMFSHQFDTTKQRAKFKVPVAELLPGEEVAQAYVTVTVMMQEACVHRYLSGPGGQREVEEQPILMEAAVLSCSNANFYLESLLRRLPIDFQNGAELRRLATCADYLWFVWTTDRDINNALVLVWFFAQIVLATPPTVLPHAEPCALHGVQLAKERFPHSRACAIQSVSFCRQFRHSSFRTGVRAAIISHVKAHCRVRRCKRSEEVVSLAAVLFQALFGDRNEYCLYVTNKASGGAAQKQRSTLLCRIDSMLESFDIERRPDGSMRLVYCHYCFVEEDPSSLAVPAGDALGGGLTHRCCTSAAEGREKVAAVVCNFVLAATWSIASVNRWAYIGQVWRKMLVLCLFDDSLMAIMDGVRRGAGLDLSLEQALARAIAENPDDFCKKNQLKVIRLCKTLGAPTSAMIMVIGVILNGVLDVIHYSILGRRQGKHDARKRACLLDFVDPATSLIGRAEDQLVQLADDFRPESGAWFLLSCLGIDFHNPTMRKLARAALIRGHTGLLHHFTKKLASAPYVWLLTLPEIDVSLTVKREITDVLVHRTPRECLPVGAQRLQDACKSAGGTATVIVEPLRAFGELSPIDTGSVERAHAQARQDLSSCTRATSTEPAQKRVFCRQMRAVHLHRGGSDPAVLDLSSLAVPADDALPACNSHAGSAQIRHQNNKMKSFKLLHAPNRKMTPSEMSAVRLAAAQEWSRIILNPEELQEWQDLNAVTSRRSKAAKRDIGRQVVVHDQPVRDFRGLWTNHTDTATIFSEATLKSLAAPAEDDQTLADPAGVSENDQDIQVAPLRCEKTGRGWTPLWGCACNVKNICRSHGLLSAPDILKLNARTAHLNSWARSLEKSLLEEVTSFALFSTSARAQDGSSLDRICLLSDCIFKPFAQYLTLCHLPGNSSTSFEVPLVPFKLRIGASPGSSRIRGSWRSFWTRTSDEFALELQRAADDWRLIPLECEFDSDSASLRDCIVLGFCSEIPMPRRAAVNKRSYAEMWEMAALDLSDDLSVLAVPAEAASVSESHQEESDEEGNRFQDGCFDSDLEAAFDESEEAIAEEDAMAAPELPDDPAASEVAAAQNAEAALAAFAEQCVLSCSVSRAGYVRCDLPPWQQKDYVGLLKEWPMHLAPDKRTVSMNCKIHRNCILVKRRRDVTDDQLLRWLFRGKVPPENTCRADMAMLVVEHKAAWDLVLHS